eukprot:COSAG03_NODE_11574_length_586_cov_0.794661_2_plen_47_part_01
MGHWVDMHVLREEGPRQGSDEGQVTQQRTAGVSSSGFSIKKPVCETQ